jgi:GDP-L-fucose synthase
LIELEGKAVWLTGHSGLVGSAILARLADEPISRLVTASSRELDLRRQQETEDFAARFQPDLVIMAAARVGGIQANRSAQGEFLYDNLIMSANVIEASRRAGVEKVIVLGSSCIYPRDSPQPMPETALLHGPLEATNEGYAIAKIAALELAKMYRRQYGMNVISLMPTNLYGPGDNFDLSSGHVLPALLRKVHEARVAEAPAVEVWGTGSPRREFLHVEDLADATLFALRHYESEQHLNVGVGRDISIRELAELIADVVGWSGEFVFVPSMPDGAPRKLLDVGRLRAIGWESRIGLREGIEDTYRWFLDHQSEARGVAASR